MKIIAVEKNSPLHNIVKPGDELIKVGGQPVLDSLDYTYKTAEESVVLTFKLADERLYDFEYLCYEYLGIEFEQDKIQICKNKCIFCFIHQQPKGMRRSLYIKDEDYRLSFTHGNFISFSNLTKNDINRIIEQGLSPLYVSVHTTDDKLRRSLFLNKNLPPILPQLKRLIDNNIKFHTQVVICPGINDGEYLEKTINDLFALYPGVETLGVVPVGLTKYRKNLPQLKSFNKELSEGIIDYIEHKQKEFLNKCGSRFVFAADEFYVLAGRDFPKISEYESMEQFENGIGMIRHMLTDFNRRKRFLENHKIKRKIVLITGMSAYPSLQKYVLPELKKYKFKIELLPIKNRFWGSKVTVTGLLTGRDILQELNKTKFNYDVAVLPPNCLNNDNLFLDDVSLIDFVKKSGREVMVGSYSLVDTLKKAIEVVN